MKKALCVLLSLCLVPLAAQADEKKGDAKKGGELTDPLEILQKVDAASKAVKAVKYDITFESTASPRAPAMTVKGTVIAVGPLIGFQPTKYFVDLEATRAGSAETRRITAGGDGETFYVVDHQEKKAYEDIDPAVVGSLGNTINSAAMIEFLHETPFTDEINGRSRELKGSKVINGVDCYQVHVVYANENAPQATWCFGKTDFLPRQRIDEFTLEGGEKVTWTKTLANLVADPKLEPDTFKLKLPEGYTKTDDFAP